MYHPIRVKGRPASTRSAFLFEEMKANLLPNARLVPAGIVTVNRAQERGYSVANSEHA